MTAVSRPAAAIVVGFVRGLDAVLGLGAAWDDLASRAPDAGPFLSRAWLEPWLRASGAPGEILAATAWAGGSLVALLVLRVRRVLGLRLAAPPDSEHPGYGGLLLDPARPDAADRLAYLCSVAPEFDVLAVGDVAEGDHATAALRRGLADRGFRVAEARRSECLSVTLGVPHDRFLRARKSPKSLKNLRQEERRLRETGDVRLVRLVGAEITADVVRRAARVQAESWMQRRGAAVLDSPFYEGLAVAAASPGAGRMWFLTVGEEDAAFGYALASHGHMHFVWTAFRLRYAPYSVGKLLVHWIVRDACDEGMRSFDFGHGDAAYKRFWATESSCVRRVAAGRGVLGAAAVAGFSVAWRIAEVPRVRTAWRAARRLLRGRAGGAPGAERDPTAVTVGGGSGT